MTRHEIKAAARVRLASMRGTSAGVLLLMALMLSLTAGITAGVGLIVSPLLTVGLYGFFLRGWRGENIGVGGWLDGCFQNAARVIGGMLWMSLWVFISCIGSVLIVLIGALIALPQWLFVPAILLCMIPGIAKAYSYCMVPFILYDLPAVRAKDALRLSACMTSGYCMDIFVTQISFAGWVFVSALTGQIVGFAHAYPYFGLTMAGVYDELKTRALEDGALTEAMLTGEERP